MRKVFDLDSELVAALQLLADDEKKSLNNVVAEALKDQLKRRGRPTNLQDALRMSLQQFHTNDNGTPKKARLR